MPKPSRRSSGSIGTGNGTRSPCGSKRRGHGPDAATLIREGRPLGEPQPTDDRKLEFELCKLRADDYNRNYYSIRDIEWRLVWEFLAGYAVTVAIRDTSACGT